MAYRNRLMRENKSGAQPSPPPKNVRTNPNIEDDRPSGQHDRTAARFYAFCVIFVAVWALIWAFAFKQMVVNGERYRELAARQLRSTETVVAKRGDILDRNGLVLATSVEIQSIYANPREIESPAETADQLAPVLGMDREEILSALSKNRSFIWLKRKVDDATSKAVRDLKIPGIHMSGEYERVYPYKHLAGQLLGFVGIDNNGLEGLELAFDSSLKGETVKNVVRMDPKGRGFSLDESVANDGKDLHLTIDAQIQFIAEEVISEAVRSARAKWGGVIIADAKNGEILAWGQYPFFNPNVKGVSPSVYRNRLASDALEPGSTIKPFVVATALETGAIDPKTSFFCEHGIWKTRWITIRDDTHSYGDLTVEEIIAKSSNIGAAKIAQRLGIKTYYEYLSKLGFGSRTGIGINESKGILRPPKQWSEVDLLSAGFGQSISVTAIQMVQAYLSLINDGLYLPAKLILDDSDPRDTEQRIFSQKTSRTVRAMMEEVVDGNGTGKRARIEGIRVAGKTGTAQKAGKKGYGNARLASFIGIVPADAPRYIVWVMLDEPTVSTYGGVLAAPVFQKVASRAMAYQGYLPDVLFAQDPQRNQGKKSPKVKFDPKIIPNVSGMGLRLAMEQYAKCGLTPSIRGSGLTVLLQDPPAGSPAKDQNGSPAECTIYMSLETPEGAAPPDAAANAPDAGTGSSGGAPQADMTAPAQDSRQKKPSAAPAAVSPAQKAKAAQTPFGQTKQEAAPRRPAAVPAPAPEQQKPAAPQLPKPAEGKTAAEKALFQLTHAPEEQKETR